MDDSNAQVIVTYEARRVCQVFITTCASGIILSVVSVHLSVQASFNAFCVLVHDHTMKVTGSLSRA